MAINEGGGTAMQNDADRLNAEIEETGARAAEVVERLDTSSRFRKLTGFSRIMVLILAVSWSLFQLYTAAFGSLEAMIQRAIHLSFALSLGFLLYPPSPEARRDRLSWLDVVLALAAAYVSYYITSNFRDITMRAGYVTTADLVCGVLAIVLVFEACRRIVGMPLATVAAVCLAYAYLGKFIPGYFGHRGFSIPRIVSHMFLTTEGIFGVPLGVSASYIFLFILFGSFLFRTGVGQLFIDLAMALAGHQPGGPAKVAVISSAMLGTINGSTVANVVGTGSFTIPLMKSIGYKKEFAGAVEAAASTGGQLMPPIMGAAAFVMAEFTGIPYLRIALGAAIPAILFYLSVIWQVHLEALKLGLKGLPREQLPRAGALLKTKGHLLLPVAVILFFLVKGYTPTYAAFFGVVSTVVVSAVSSKTRLSFAKLIEALEAGARDAISIAVACSVIGFIIGTATLTGLGVKVAGGIVQMAGGNLMLTLVFTMIASLVLGMGLPTTANYIVTSTMAAPALLALGVPVLSAHMFVFYYGIISDLTPPVALGAMAGAGLAGGDPLKTGIQATKLALVSYIVPFFFVLSPVLLGINTTVVGLIWGSASAVLGVLLLGIGLEGYFLSPLCLWERLLAIPAGIALIDPGIVTDLIGLGALAVLVVRQRQTSRRAQLGSRTVF